MKRKACAASGACGGRNQVWRSGMRRHCAKSGRTWSTCSELHQDASMTGLIVSEAGIITPSTLFDALHRGVCRRQLPECVVLRHQNARLNVEDGCTAQRIRECFVFWQWLASPYRCFWNGDAAAVSNTNTGCMMEQLADEPSLFTQGLFRSRIRAGVLCGESVE